MLFMQYLILAANLIYGIRWVSPVGRLNFMDEQEAAKAMLPLAEQLSDGRLVALSIAGHASKHGVSPLPLLEAAQGVGLVLGHREFRALLDDGGLMQEQVGTGH